MNNLMNKPGIVTFSRSIFCGEDGLDILKSIGLNILTSSIKVDDVNDNLIIIGFSEYFRILEEDDIIPNYDMMFFRDENRTKFNGFVELKTS